MAGNFPNPLLIPRYNWDFDFGSFLRTTAASFRRGSLHPVVAQTFGNDPILTTSGRASLVAILRALGLREGAGVAVPLYCCPVVFEAIEFAGCKPVFVDVRSEDNCMSAADLRRKIDRVSAVVVVHMFGHPAEMDHLREAAGNTPLIEDCAHSLFSEYRGMQTGLLGDAAFFSFRNGKYLSSGEASVVLARDEGLRNSIRDIVASFEGWGKTREMIHAAVSYAKSLGYQRPYYGLAGFRLGRAIDASLNLSAKSGISLQRASHGYLGLIEHRLKNFRSKIARQRENSLALLNGIRAGGIVLPQENPAVKSNYYQFGIRLPDSTQRDDLAGFLLSRGIDAARYLDDIIDVTTREYGYKGDCPVSEEISRTLLVLPNHYTLSSSSIRNIAEAVTQWAGRTP